MESVLTQPLSPSPARVRLGELTGRATKELVGRNPVILVPLGSIEDQGPHAPVGDYLIAERICELIARQSTSDGAETYVAPVIPFGGDDYCGSSPAGMVLSQATLAAVLRDVVGSLARSHLDRVIVVNGHGGNVAVVQDVTRQHYRATGQIVPCLNLWRSAHALLPDVVGAERARETLAHGSDPLTSIVMHLFPDLIDVSALVAPPPRLSFKGLMMKSYTNADLGKLDVQLPVDAPSLVPSGVWGGNPCLASPETGANLVARLVELGGAFVVQFKTMSVGAA